MRSLLRAAAITFFAFLSTEDDQKMASVVNCVRVKSALEQKSTKPFQKLTNISLGLQDQQLLETGAQIKLDLQNKLSAEQRAQIASMSELELQNQAKWGFLKNIVNIDRFFASGAEDSKKSSLTQVEEPASSSKVQKKSKKQQKKKAQTEQAEDDGEEEVTQVEAEISQKRQQTKKSKASPVQAKAKPAREEQQEDQQADQEQQAAPEQQQQTETAAEQQNQEQTNQDAQPEQAQAQTTTEEATEAEAAAAVAALAKEAQQTAAAPATPPAPQPVKKPAAVAQAKPVIKQEETYHAVGEESKVDLVFKTKEERDKHAESVRNEGIQQSLQAMVQNRNVQSTEIDLEIEAPGSANKVAEEGAKTIQTQDEFARLSKQLADARKKPDNKLGKGGFLIELKNPKDFENSMRVVVMNTPDQDENLIKGERFDTKDQEQTKTASMAMAMTLQTEVGATIVDDQPGKESIIQNFNSDTSKTTSQISSGYSIRHNFVQKMAPGDKQFHLVSWDKEKKFNNMKTFQKRKLADKGFADLGDIAKILVSGETGDVVVSNGEQNLVDQCLGMFFTQRYQGKYFGQP